MNNKLYLIDGFGLIYRAYFAFGARPLVTKQGENVSALFGFFNSLIALLQKDNPEYIAVILESTVPNFRHLMYPEYKATRQKMPDELRAQIPILLEMIGAFGLPSYYLDGYEADDLIATIARRAEEQNIETLIVSADKDLAQLVTEHIKIYDPKTAEILGREEVKVKFELYPEQISDFLALTGDASDNIPGVPKIGKKTAVELLNEFNSLENLYQNLDKVKRQVIVTTLNENRHLANLSYALTNIKTIADYNFEMNNFRLQAPDKKLFLEYCQRYELGRLTAYANKMPDSAIPSDIKDLDASNNRHEIKESKTYCYKNLNKSENFKELESLLAKTSKLFLAYQIDNHKNINSMALAIDFDNCFMLNFDTANEMSAADDLFGLINQNSSLESSLFDLLTNFSLNSTNELIGYDLKLFLKCSDKWHYKSQAQNFDLMLAAYCLDCGQGDYSLQAIAEQLVHDIYIIEDSQPTMEDLFKILYCHEKTTEEFKANSNQFSLYKNIEAPLTSVLTQMEQKGILINSAKLLQLSSETGRQMQEVAKSVFRECNEEFNLDSPKQLGTILFERLNLPHGRKGKSGSYSTDNAILTKLSQQGHKIADQILVYREKAKLKNTYLDGLLKIINPFDNRIHTTYNQCIAATGRLSSSEPNLQSIPIRSEEGGQIRTAFVAPEGYSIISADYSQIELRILAHYTKDEELIKAFLNGEDIHAHTASVLFNIPQNQVDRATRSKAKIANFSVLYGKTVFGLSEDMQISFAEASEFVQNYFSKFPGIKNYIKDTEAFAERYGFVTTLYGRKRSIPEAKSPNKNIQNAALRMAVNTPIQGTAADVIKIAMINISRKISNFQAKMLLQVHDELIFEVKDENIAMFTEFIKHEMETVAQLAVPLEVNIGAGKSWFEAH